MNWFNSDNNEDIINNIYKSKSSLYDLLLKEELLKNKIQKYEIDIKHYNTNITSLLTSTENEANSLLIETLNKNIDKLTNKINKYEAEIKNINEQRITIKKYLNEFLKTIDDKNYMNNISYTKGL